MKKKYLYPILALLIIGAALLVGIKLVREPQLIDKQAATPGGIASMSLSPNNKTLIENEETTIEVKLNTQSALVDGYQTYLTYTYSGSEAPIEIIGSTVTTSNPVLTQCPVNSITHNPSEKKYTMIVSCLLPLGSASPYTTNSQDVTLFTFPIKAKSTGSINLDFSTDFTKVTKFDDHTDILGIPTSGVYSVGSNVPTNTPSPIPSPTPSSTPLPTQPPGQGGDNTPTNTPVPTGSPNSCGGTCGSNANCQGSFICWQGYCRNPLCVNTSNCSCQTPTSTPIPPTPTQGGDSLVYPTPTTEIVEYQSPTPMASYTDSNPFMGGSGTEATPEVSPVEYQDVPQPKKLGFTAWIIESISNFFKKLFGQR